MQIKYKNTNSITGLIVPVANIFQKHILNPILKTQPKVLKKEPFWKVELSSDNLPRLHLKREMGLWSF